MCRNILGSALEGVQIRVKKKKKKKCLKIGF